MAREYGPVLAVLVVIVVVYLLASGRLSFSTSPAAPYQLARAGESLGPDEQWEPTLPYTGTLEGAFVVTNGTAELCVTIWISWILVPTPSCPANATYNSGLVTSGTLRAVVASGSTWLSVLGYPGYNGDDPNVELTFTTALELVPAS